MALSVRAAGTIAVSSGAANSILVTVPTVSNGDMMVLIVSNSGTVGFSTPAGWTLRKSGAGSGGPANTFIFTRTASSEPANYTVSLSASTGNLAGQIITVKSDNGSTITFDVAGSQSNASSTTDTAAGITLANTNEMVVAAFAWAANGTTFSAPAGFTNATNANSNTALELGTCAKVFAASGATGAQSATNDVAGANVGLMVSFYEAAVVIDLGNQFYLGSFEYPANSFRAASLRRYEPVFSDPGRAWFINDPFQAEVLGGWWYDGDFPMPWQPRHQPFNRRYYGEQDDAGPAFYLNDPNRAEVLGGWWYDGSFSRSPQHAWQPRPYRPDAQAQVDPTSFTMLALTVPAGPDALFAPGFPAPSRQWWYPRREQGGTERRIAVGLEDAATGLWFDTRPWQTPSWRSWFPFRPSSHVQFEAFFPLPIPVEIMGMGNLTPQFPVPMRRPPREAQNSWWPGNDLGDLLGSWPATQVAPFPVPFRQVARAANWWLSLDPFLLPGAGMPPVQAQADGRGPWTVDRYAAHRSHVHADRVLDQGESISAQVATFVPWQRPYFPPFRPDARPETIALGALFLAPDDRVFEMPQTVPISLWRRWAMTGDTSPIPKLPDANEAILGSWNVQPQTPRWLVQPAGIRQTMAEAQSVRVGAFIDSIGWYSPWAEQPLIVARRQSVEAVGPGNFLSGAEAPFFWVWSDSIQAPVRHNIGPARTHTTEAMVAAIGAVPNGLIIISGPYFVFSGQIYVAGVAQGDLSSE